MHFSCCQKQGTPLTCPILPSCFLAARPILSKDAAPFSWGPGMVIATGNLHQTLTSLNHELQSPDLSRRLAAINALAGLGPRRRREVLSLVESLKDRSVFVRKSAALALGEIGSRTAVFALRRALADEDASVRRCAALALMNIGEESSSVAA